jgi:membrane-bound metal-dependent hydrolase YbcI (DUF457 family)
MLWIGHLSLGYLVYRALLSLYPTDAFSQFQLHILLAIALIASILPDADFIAFFRKNKSLKLQKDSSHRTQMSHAPLAYVLIGAVLYLLSYTFFFKAASMLFTLGTLSHFLGDSIEYGIMWLWPLSSKQYSLRHIPRERIKSNTVAGYYWEFFWEIYVRNWTFWIELAALVAAVWLAL